MRENVEIVRRGFDAFNRGDVEAWLAVTHPEIEVADDPRVPGGTTLHGHAEIKRYFESLSRYCDSLRLVPERFVDRGDEVLVLTRMTARTRRGGPEIERPLDQAFSLRSGKVIRVRTFSTREQALEAAGLSE